MKMKNTVRGYKIDFANNTLYMNYKFAQAANNPKSEEYGLVAGIKKDFPNIKVITRAGRKQTTCNASKRLTYKNMQDYIMGQDNYEPLLASFMLARIESKCAKSPYAFVRDWFIKQFPDYQECKVFKREKIISFADTAPTEEQKISS